MEQQHGTFGMTSARTLRLAKSSECGSLSALALRSKAYWGYDSAFLQACRDELTVSPKAAAAGRVVVLIEQETPLGFYALDAGDRRDEAEISLLFVEPAAIGRGIGRALWEHAVAKARREGLRRLKVLSDRSEHTSELQSLMRISDDVFCLKKKK